MIPLQASAALFLCGLWMLLAVFTEIPYRDYHMFILWCVTLALDIWICFTLFGVI